MLVLVLWFQCESLLFGAAAVYVCLFVNAGVGVGGGQGLLVCLLAKD